MIAYISGHLDLTVNEFYEHYREAIDKAMLAGDSFVIGDAIGVDWIAQTYLVATQLPIPADRLIIYHMLERPRHAYSEYEWVGGFQSDEERDAAMTSISDYDIAWVRPGREKSGTAKNLLRRNTKDFV